MKKYIFFDGPLKQRMGGPSTYLYNLKNGIDSIKSNDICFIYLEDLEVDNNKSNLKKIIKKVLSIYPPLYERIIMRWKLKRKKIFEKLQNLKEDDIVMFHMTKDFAKALPVLPENCKKILMSHSPEVTAQEESTKLRNQFPKYSFKFTEKEYYKRFDLEAFKNADIVVFPSKESMEPYRKTMPNFDKIMKGKKIKFLLSGTEQLSYKISKNDFRKKYNIPKNSFVISFIGRHNSIKGYDIFVQICNKIMAKYDDVYIITAGTGNIQSPVHSNWIDIGWTDDPGSVANASDLFMLPNKQTYFDLVLIEMMSLGKVCLVSNTGGNKTMKKFSKGIITFNNVNDAVQNFENLYKNRKEIKILEKSNLDAYKKYFTVQRFCERYIEFFDSLK